MAFRATGKRKEPYSPTIKKRPQGRLFLSRKKISKRECYPYNPDKRGRTFSRKELFGER